MKRRATARITTGSLKGRSLRYPSDGRVRPSAARTKEALFDALGDDVRGGVFVDLYAAAGGVGIEALSRGARFVHFVERDGAALSCLSANLEACGVKPARFRIHATSVEDFVAAGALDDPEVRVVFADPPYDVAPETVLALLDEKAYPHVRRLVVEHRGAPSEREWRWWQIERTRRYGDTSLTQYTPKQGSDS